MAVFRPLVTLAVFCSLNVRADIEPDTSHYHSYKMVEATFKQYAEDFPSMARVYSIGKSVQNRYYFTL